ncbi:MAG: LysR family transcriptional regulator [Clostridia bacterium]|nr:LysR family transcriptional regulator [Clostridia bacterium]
MMDPKLSSLLEVYETGNFTRAAERLSLTQPAVSQHIRALEKDFGVRIFERSHSALHVTREGEIVVRYARRMQSLYNNLVSELKSERRQMTALTVGITHTAESNAIPETFARYVDQHEKVSIKIITDTIDNLCVKLHNYELDLAVVEGRVSDPTLHCQLLDTDYLVLAVSPTHPLARRTMVTIDDLKKEKLILRLPSSSTRTLLVSSLESRNLHLDDFNVVLEIDNIATIKDLIRRDFGVSVLARSACMDELRKKKIVVLPIENLTMVREINLVYAQDFNHAELLQDIVRAYSEARNQMTRTLTEEPVKG